MKARSIKTGTIAIAIWLSLRLAIPAWSQQTRPDLTEISLDSLLDMKVTIGAKQAEKISDTAAAVSVVTQEDMQRNGFTSVPEALRMVPGLDVARVSGGLWAISARGFNAPYADKLLVLVDGRTMYSPSFSGVLWDIQDVPIEDIERIEVIRGPGAALWGANAVNGVINIITKSANSTKGGLFVAGTGSEERGFSSIRWGGDLGKSGAYRFSSKLYDSAPLQDASTGRLGIDSSHLGSAGFRADWGSGRDSFTLSGNLYRGYSGSSETTIDPLTPPGTHYKDSSFSTGANVLGRWTREYSSTSGISLQSYIQRADRNDPRGSEHALTVDTDFQHRFSAGSRNKFIWGTAYRQVIDDLIEGVRFSAAPPRRNISLFSVFAQDDISLPGHLRLTLGAKAEEYNFGGDNLQPSASLLWAPLARHSIWTSASHAVNSISRLEADMHVLASAVPLGDGTNAIVTLSGNPAIKPPTVNAFEAGYRYKRGNRFYVDLATFYNAYRRLYTSEPGAPSFDASAAVPHLDLPLTFANGMYGETYGAETTASIAPTERWKITGSFSLLRMQLHLFPGSHDPTAESAETQSPRNQFQIHSSYNLTSSIHADSALYFTGKLPGFGIDSYSRLDLNLSWNFVEKASVSFGVQNALNATHREFFDTGGTQPTLVRRSASVKVQWHF